MPGQIAQVPVDENETYLRTQFSTSDNRNYRDGDRASTRYFNFGTSEEESEGKDDKLRMYESPKHSITVDDSTGVMVKKYDKSNERTTLVNDDVRVYKGGSWRDRAYWLDPASRRYFPQDMATDYIGFRNAMSKVGPKSNKKTPRGNPKQYFHKSNIKKPFRKRAFFITFVTMKTALLYQYFLNCNSVCTDTRKITENCIFFALKGENFDANTFATTAIEKGAKYVVIDNPNYEIEGKTILVQDTLVALQKLANFHRKQLHLKIIALTGSNGKTTTKELIHAVLSKRHNTIATIGNLNNHIGVPLTLLRLTKETEIGIIEMGANHQKEIEFLCEIAAPDFGYITNFGKAHLEGFGGVEGVIKGKSEMYTFLQKNKKLVFVNLDDAIQEEKTKQLHLYTFSKEKKANIKIDSIDANPMVKIGFENTTIQSHLIGLYNANNINAAITIGKYFGVPNHQIKEAIENYIPENNRSQLIKKGTNEIILDAYNANPSSMQVAIENFKQLQHNKKIAILGDMFELGEESIDEHKKTIILLSEEPKITTYFIGKDFYSNTIEKEHFIFFKDFTSFATHLQSIQINNSLILIKGSRGMALERTLEIIE
jgi:UDP-N-acetylmuramoyl-tripeptide--D-alanyl-D-alanine ligase